MKYVTLASLQNVLQSRITIVDDPDLYDLRGQTNTVIGLDIVNEITEEVEDGFIDIYLGMLYELPLKNKQPFINGIARDMIVGKIYQFIMPLFSEDQRGDNFGIIMEKKAISTFSALFSGTGIVIPGIENPQNDENRIKQSSKPIILPGEVMKKYIGYDYDKDGVSDTNIYKREPIRSDEFYMQGDFNEANRNAKFIESGVQTRRYRNPITENYIEDVINFW